MTASRRGEIALLAFGVLLALLLAEGAMRFTGVAEEAPSGYPFVDTTRRFMRPRNSKGYRDDEHELRKTAGVNRLVSLGDSFAWGAGMEYDDAYPHRLGRALARRRGERWEVVNLALSGMNTVEQAAQLREEGLAYAPDVVVVGYVLNDSEDENAIEARRSRDFEQRRRERKARKASRLERSALYRLVSTRLSATADNRRRVAAYEAMYAPDYPGWVAAQQALKDMGAMCRQRGIPLVIAIFPLFGNPLDERYPFAGLHAKVKGAAAAAGAEVVDLLPAYRGLRWELLVVNGAEDEHPNEIAHRIAAGEILKTLASPKASGRLGSASGVWLGGRDSALKHRDLRRLSSGWDSPGTRPPSITDVHPSARRRARGARGRSATGARQNIRPRPMLKPNTLRPGSK